MHTSFTIPVARCSILTDPKLREEIHGRTGSDAETSSILRSIGRFGHDSTIRCYELTPKPTRRTYQTTPGFAWTVTAVR